MVVAFSGGGTGGHFYPALNIARALAELVPEMEPFFVGTQGRIEARELPKLGYGYLLLPLQGLRRASAGAGSLGKLLGVARRSARNLAAIWKLLLAVLRLAMEFRRRRVLAVVLTGGYASAPAGIAAGVLGLPLLVQEQNMYPGKTTRLVSRWARQILVSYPGARSAFPVKAQPRVRETGNPIRPLPLVTEERDRDVARRALGLPLEGLIVLVVGGSQGAGAINRATLEACRTGQMKRQDFAVLWVTGTAHYKELTAVLSTLEAERVHVVPYLEPDEMYRALAAVDLAVSRAGAMTTSEFLAWGVPSVLVPLPTAAEDHQSRNADALEKGGASVHVPERDPQSGGQLTGRRLWGRVRRLLDDRAALDTMARAARRLARPDGAYDVARVVAELLNAGRSTTSRPPR